MGYGDYTPSSGGRAKPLTKKQIEQAKNAYAKADEIAQALKLAEEKEVHDADETLKGLEIL